MEKVLEETDIIVVGAGISGIDMAYHLKTHCKNYSFKVLGGRENIGGTWDLYRYPGIRSDSDMHTFSFGFNPWKYKKALAEGHEILQYLNDTVDKFDLRKHISFKHKITQANWSPISKR